MKTIFILLLSFGLLLTAVEVQAQTAARPTKADSIPAAYGCSADSLAFYIDTHFDRERDKVEAIYAWITTHLTYNVYTTFMSRNEVYSEERDIQRVLDEGTGICRQFALLFRTVAEKMGIPAFVVSGYNKAGGVLLSTPHDWCAAFVDGRWLIYDPTFGMGYIQNNQFVHAPTMRYCHRTAETMIHSHMPYDPIWQLMEVPYSYDEFDKGLKPVANQTHRCSYKDSIQVYLDQPRLEQLTSSYNRVKSNGTPNQLVTYYLQLTQANISVNQQRLVYDVYKEAVKKQNRSADMLNDFIRFRNRGFKPDKEETMIRGELNDIRLVLSETDSLLHTLTVIPQVYQSAWNNLLVSVQSVSQRLDDQLAFVDRYYTTPRSKRKHLFPNVHTK